MNLPLTPIPPPQEQMFFEVQSSEWNKNELISPEEEKLVEAFYKNNPLLKQASKIYENGTGLIDGFDPEEAWIQTYSGRRFNPLKPVKDSIVIQDIAHALSMQCRFTGHCAEFYSVAQHSVLVSYFCKEENRLHGLLHDASEAYICDLSAPLKRTDKFESYREIEKNLQKSINQRFNLAEEEPIDVKKADVMMLSTEARDLLKNRREDWRVPVNPVPLKIIPLPPSEAEKLFLNRFYELVL